jgi:hypothetical protein
MELNAAMNLIKNEKTNPLVESASNAYAPI